MKSVYIKISELDEYDIRMLEEQGYYKQDIISIDNLFSIIDDLQDDKRRLEEQIEEMKEPIDYEDNHNSFDYGEWKMSIDSANGR